MRITLTESVRDFAVGNVVLAADLSNEASKHELDLMDSSLKLIVLTRCQELKISREQKEIVQFACRTQRDVKILPQLESSGPAAALSNVGGNRERGASHLAGQPLTLGFGERSCNAVNAQCHGMTFLPDQKFAKILHQSTAFFSFTYNLLLTTYNYLWEVIQCS
jgi:hypothetical protein